MNPYTINPPESEVTFEKLCLALLKRYWSRPGLERFAKKGEKQFPSSAPNIAFRLLAEFVLRMSVESLLPETRCIATKALLNTFPNDAKTNAQLAAFRSQCAGLMTLNPLAQADFLKCFDQWKKERLTRSLIVKPSSS